MWIMNVDCDYDCDCDCNVLSQIVLIKSKTKTTLTPYEARVISFTSEGIGIDMPSHNRAHSHRATQ